MPKVRLTKSATHAFRGLPPTLREAALSALTALETDGQAGHRLRGRLAGVWSLRVGAYRFLYVIEEGGALVRVLAVRHRSVAYDNDPL
ncbi:MAG: type II toxin-antitoxin system RelE family toxin [Egibacteraceae bacterium]